MTFRNKIYRYFPLVFLLQLPIILGYILPLIFYNSFFYTDIEIENNYILVAKKNYLIALLVINLICFVLFYFLPTKKNLYKNFSINFFFIIIVSIFSAICTLISKLLVFEYYYFNLIFYIGQNCILILFLFYTTHDYNKRDLIIIISSILFCNLISLYSGDSKFFLITLLVFLIVGYLKYSFKKILFLGLIFLILSVLILGSKKIYRDYVHSGGMDKLNYKYNEKNVTYTNKFNYKNTENFFFKQKLQFLLFSKSFLYSNICGDGSIYKNDRNIEKLIHDLIFKNGKLKSEKIELSTIKNVPNLKKLIFSKTQNHCFFFFSFLSRIDFLTPLAQSVREVNFSNQLKGDTYKPIIYFFIPRFIYENKPIDNADQLYMNLMSKLKNVKDKNRTVISVSILTEAWINYLEKGIFLIGIIYGIMMTTIAIFYFSQNFYLKVLSSSLSIHILNFNLSLKQIISGSYQVFVIFIFLYFLNILFLRYYKNRK